MLVVKLGSQITPLCDTNMVPQKNWVQTNILLEMGLSSNKKISSDLLHISGVQMEQSIDKCTIIKTFVESSCISSIGETFMHVIVEPILTSLFDIT